MLSSLLSDAALALAKAYSHDEVEPRHVLYAVARHFRSDPEVGPLVAAAKGALEPRGTSHQVPQPTADAAVLLESFTSERKAIAALLVAYGGGEVPAAGPEGAAQLESTPKPEYGDSAEAGPSANVGREEIGAVLAELDGLIGLASVKGQLKRVIAVVQANEERSRAGLPPVNPGLHLVFTGPPGTGKTTVARLVARLYAAAGALPAAKFTEASRSDLVAGYVGQTAIKTSELIAKTRPGVLFIDEAYSLTPSHDSDFGAEAIATLVKAMEDFRHEFAVIVAGYGEEMSALIASNPGLKSRFKTYVAFPDYTASELTQIFQGLAAKSQITLSDGVLDKAKGIFDKYSSSKEFGNARFARFLFEEGYARMSARALADGSLRVDELTNLSLEDIEWDDGVIAREVRRIGFGGAGEGFADVRPS